MRHRFFVFASPASIDRWKLDKCARALFALFTSANMQILAVRVPEVAEPTFHFSLRCRSERPYWFCSYSTVNNAASIELLATERDILTFAVNQLGQSWIRISNWINSFVNAINFTRRTDGFCGFRQSRWTRISCNTHGLRLSSTQTQALPTCCEKSLRSTISPTTRRHEMKLSTLIVTATASTSSQVNSYTSRQSQIRRTTHG